MSNSYNNSLFNCMPCGLCLKGCCCTCILVGQNHARITKNESKDDAGACSGWCWGWCGLQGCLGAGWVLQMVDRGRFAEQHDIQSSGFKNCCTAFWCSPCEAIQTSKELDYVQLSQNANKGYTLQGEKMVAQAQVQPYQ